MKTSDKLNGSLVEINKQSGAISSQLVEQMAEHEGISEELKAEHPMKWIGKMNVLHELAAKIVNTEVIFT